MSLKLMISLNSSYIVFNETTSIYYNQTRKFEVCTTDCCINVFDNMLYVYSKRSSSRTTEATTVCRRRSSVHPPISLIDFLLTASISIITKQHYKVKCLHMKSIIIINRTESSPTKVKFIYNLFYRVNFRPYRLTMIAKYCILMARPIAYFDTFFPFKIHDESYPL